VLYPMRQRAFQIDHDIVALARNGKNSFEDAVDSTGVSFENDLLDVSSRADVAGKENCGHVPSPILFRTICTASLKMLILKIKASAT